MKKYHLTLLLVLLLVGLGVANFQVLRDLTDISTGLPVPVDNGRKDDGLTERPVVRIGVISRFAPNVTYTGYQPIMDYLNRLGTHRYELQLSTSYQDAVDRLLDGRVDASFLGSWIYGHIEAGDDLPPIAAPLNRDGLPDFQAVLVTRSDSDLESLSQLAGRRVALPSPQSWSGNWLNTNGLSSVNLTPADLDSLHHFDHHHTVVWQVLRGNFDAGVVKESVAEEYRSEGLRSVAFSPPIPGPPLVGRPDGDPAVFEEISRLLLALDPGIPADKHELESWSPEFSYGFTAVDRRQYRDAFLQEVPE